MTKVCICGGGSLGHVCAGVLSSQSDVEVNVFTQQPQRWSKTLTITDLEGKIYQGNLHLVSNSPQDVVQGCDIVFLCLPGFAIADTLRAIKPFLDKKTVVGSIVSSSGFFFFAHDILGDQTPLFGFQRTPFIARTKEYGASANLLGYKPQVAIAVENVADKESFRALVEKLWITPTKLLGSHYEVSLSNSNPILHTGRLFSMWHDWSGKAYDHNILFYKEWTDVASQTIIDMDAEFMTLLRRLPVAQGAIPPLLEYYESHDAASLTQKISSIAAFQNITSPMVQTPDGWVPDFQSRYFTEDFPYGLKFIVELMRKNNLPAPTIEKVFEWGMYVQNAAV